MSLTIERITEYGFEEAMIGLSLNKKQDKNMEEVAKKLSGKGFGHDKFMRQMAVWILVKAPLYWWKQMDQYNFIVTQSESTMHTIMKKPLKQEDFSADVPNGFLELLNKDIANQKFTRIVGLLPSSYYQKRMIFTNYAQLDTIIKQRKNHKLKEWHLFIDGVLDKLEHKEFLEK